MLEMLLITGSALGTVFVIYLLAMVVENICLPKRPKKCAKCRLRNECWFLKIVLRFNMRFKIKYADKVNTTPPKSECDYLLEKYGVEKYPKRKKRKK